MEEIKQCNICGNAEFSVYIECRDHFLTQELFTIVRCKKCGFLFVNPLPEKDKLHSYYDSPEYISHSGTSNGLINSIYKKARNYTHKKKFRIISKYAKGKTILDVGCGSGELLKLFKHHNWETLGIEPNSKVREFAKLSYGLKILEEDQIINIPEKSIDVITLWHVLEHVSDLNERMQELKRILKNDGVLIIAVPNCISYDAIYYGKYWAAYDVPRHLYHFTPNTIKQLLNKFNFSITNILPMKFDSYYVSMLSEKYKSGRTNMIKALFIGLKSNIRACKDKASYSSQIYVIRNT
ncbi:MAG: class I SAM-dependent methyltransferase [Bacteroidales bacterium]